MVGNTSDLLIGTLLPFFAVLMVVVFVHEMGHYLVGRWCGIGVEAFSIGFGPEFLGFTDKRGTRWKFSAVPLGGYVKFVGDVGASSVPDTESLRELSDSQRAVAFQLKPLWKKALTVLAGPVANFILAIVILAAFFMIYGKAIVEPVAGSVQPNSPAAAAGIQPGDRFISVQGRPITTFADMQHFVTARAGDPMEFVLDRAGTQLTVTITPELMERTDALGNTIRMGLIGVAADTSEARIKRIDMAPLAAVQEGFAETGRVIDRTLLFLQRFAAGREDRCQLGGPVKIAEMAGQAADRGFFWLVSLTAMLSIGIGILNLMPVPPLDGGHLLVYGLEGIMRRPLPDWFQEWLYKAGFFAVLALMAFVFWNDLVAC
ncbi:MAG: RIP metalloprotease RseP [Phyllobacteriaceae bacterium]|nr:RIP metalloprotease RseP [Phyllobacteriaceae bacterium]